MAARCCRWPNGTRERVSAAATNATPRTCAMVDEMVCVVWFKVVYLHGALYDPAERNTIRTCAEHMCAIWLQYRQKAARYVFLWRQYAYTVCGFVLVVSGSLARA